MCLFDAAHCSQNTANITTRACNILQQQRVPIHHCDLASTKLDDQQYRKAAGAIGLGQVHQMSVSTGFVIPATPELLLGAELSS